MATDFPDCDRNRRIQDFPEVRLSADEAEQLSRDDLADVLELARHSGFIAPTSVSAQSGDLAASDHEPLVFEQPTLVVKEVFGIAFGAMQGFAHMLEAEGEVRGLIGPREASRLWSRHLVNSAAVLKFLPRRGSVLDIGSGAGFPGMVIAICRPDLEVFLLEPMLRRCEWLSDVITELDLDNVHVIQGRAEELRGKLKADVVTARAVANMTKLVRITTRLIAPRGQLIALKGRRAQEEVDAASVELRKHHLKATVHQVPSIMEDESTYVVSCQRIK